MLFSAWLLYHWHLHQAVSNLKVGISWPQSKYLAHKLSGGTNITEFVLMLLFFDITVFKIRLCRHIKPESLHQSQTFIFLYLLPPSRSLMMVWTGQAWTLLDLGDFAKGKSLTPFLSALKKTPANSNGNSDPEVCKWNVGTKDFQSKTLCHRGLWYNTNFLQYSVS